MNINKDKLLDKLIKTFVREKENVDKDTIRYLARRYARYKSGSDCCLCWGHPADESKGRKELKCYCGMEVKYTPAEKVAYTYLNYDKLLENA